MEYQVDFKCINDHVEEIHEEVLKQTKVQFPEVHKSSNQMTALAKAIKNHSKDTFAVLPFCLTVEAEAMGADIKLGDNTAGPRVGNYVYNSIEELENISDIDFSSNRIAQVLEALENLSNESVDTILNVQGPFTVVTSLIDPRIFFKAARKDPDLIDKVMVTIKNNICKYIEEGIKRGAKIISYSDSSGTIDILGPKMYKEYSGKYSSEILKEVCNALDDSILHICGVTSTSLHSGGFITSTPIEVDSNFTYGEALNYVINERKDVKILGHNCLKKTTLAIKKPIVWSIKLN